MAFAPDVVEALHIDMPTRIVKTKRANTRFSPRPCQRSAQCGRYCNRPVRNKSTTAAKASCATWLCAPASFAMAVWVGLPLTTKAPLIAALALAAAKPQDVRVLVDALCASSHKTRRGGALVNIAARLQGVAKPGGICISDDAFRQVKSQLDLKVSDLGPVPLKNIAEPMRAYLLEVGAPREARSPPLADQAKSAPKRPSSPASLAAAATLLLLVAAGGWYMLGDRLMKPAQAAHLSIVVLPFANLSGDPPQDYFADGVTENLTTDLSRIRNSFVIARNTAFTFRGKNVDAKEIGKELGVRYVLEGSVQRDQNRVRVNAQLIDAGSGAHLWADRFEEDVADLFKLQDQVVARLANSLGYELVMTEAEKDARSKSPDAVDLTMRGWALVWQEQQQQRTKENNNAAQALFEQALKVDPNETDALAGDAYTYLLEYVRGWTTTGTDYEAKILGQADRAITLAPDNVWAYNVKSLYLTNTQRANEGLNAADAGLAVNPDDPPLYYARGVAKIVLGRYEQAISDVQQAIRLSPRDPENWFVAVGFG